MNAELVIGAFTALDALVFGTIISLSYGTFGYRKGAPYGLGKEGFKTYAFWGWSGPRRLDEKIRASEKGKREAP